MKVAFISALAVLAIPASALAATDRIQSPGQFFAGGGGPGGEFRLDAGTRAQLDNTDPTAEHNVVAVADGPDGRELFRSDLIGQGTTEVVGTEYLTAGAYPFLCTIHNGMTGTLRIEGAGAQPRPSATVAVVSSKLKKVRKGKLKVSVSAATASGDVSLVTRVGKRTLPAIDGIDVGAGRTRTLTIRLGRSVTKPLEDLERAKVTLSASVPFGAPASAKRTLR